MKSERNKIFDIIIDSYGIVLLIAGWFILCTEGNRMGILIFCFLTIASLHCFILTQVRKIAQKDSSATINTPQELQITPDNTYTKSMRGGRYA